MVFVRYFFLCFFLISKAKQENPLYGSLLKNSVKTAHPTVGALAPQGSNGLFSSMLQRFSPSAIPLAPTSPHQTQLRPTGTFSTAISLPPTETKPYLPFSVRTLPTRPSTIVTPSPIYEEQLPPPENNEDALFNSSLPQVKPGIDYSRYEITHFPFERNIKQWITETQTGIRNNPALSFAGGLGGAAAGYVYTKGFYLGAERGLDFLKSKPAITTQWPKLSNFVTKMATNPAGRRFAYIESIGRFCALGVGYAIKNNASLRQKWNSFIGLFGKK